MTYHDICILSITPLLSRESPGYDRLGKVRPVINHLLERFVELYNPHKHLTVDEEAIYAPETNQARHQGVGTGCSTNGYFSKFDVYTGKGNSVDKGLGAGVVYKGTHL